MGTRNLTIVSIDNEYKIAQYGQWDGYPSGQGKTVLTFCREHLQTNRALFERKVRATQWLTKEDELELAAKIKMYGEAWQFKFPEFTRDTGANILNLVLTQEPGMKLKNEIEFVADSLFCEWAYLIDLDKNTLEIYAGFNHKKKIKLEYHPIRLVKSYPLDSLPTQEQFETDLTEEEGKE